MENRTPKLLNRKLSLDTKFMRVFEDEIELPDGLRTPRVVVERPIAVVVVAPVAGQKNMVLAVEQHRWAAQNVLIELPAGKVEKGEDDLQAVAMRELEEETGYTATEMKWLGKFYASPGYSTELLIAYWAIGARPLEPHERREADEDERITVTIVDISNWKFEDAKSIAAVTLYQRALVRA